LEHDQVLLLPSVGIRRSSKDGRRTSVGDIDHLGQSSRRNSDAELGKADGSDCLSTSESGVTMEIAVDSQPEKSSLNPTTQVLQDELSLPPPWWPARARQRTSSAMNNTSIGLPKKKIT
jgi:hypothetical protein